jgi:hypothetical protein
MSTGSSWLLSFSNNVFQLAMSAHENATPIRILHNAAGHLAGPARSFGAVLMGYLGMFTCSSSLVWYILLSV